MGDLHGLRPVAGERSTLADQALAALREAIFDGRLEGEGLYSVAALADRLEVSRTPVREALLALERQGLVRFERNRGVRILQSSAGDLDEIFGLRLLLEVPVARIAAANFGPDELAELGGVIARMGEHVDDPDDTAFMQLDREFHTRVLRAAGNRRLVDVVAGMRDFVRFRGVSTVRRGRSMRTILDEHERILDALRAGDADAAETAMREHLVNTRRVLFAETGE